MEGTQVTITFDWAAHSHDMKTETMKAGSSCYAGDEYVTYCTLCSRAAGQSDIPATEHARHPVGCLCVTCVRCRCAEVQEREEVAKRERAEKMKRDKMAAVRSRTNLSLEDIKVALEGTVVALRERDSVLRTLQSYVEAREGLEPGALDSV